MDNAIRATSGKQIRLTTLSNCVAEHQANAKAFAQVLLPVKDFYGLTFPDLKWECIAR